MKSVVQLGYHGVALWTDIIWHYSSPETEFMTGSWLSEAPPLLGPEARLNQRV